MVKYFHDTKFNPSIAVWAEGGRKLALLFRFALFARSALALNGAAHRGNDAVGAMVYGQDSVGTFGNVLKNDRAVARAVGGPFIVIHGVLYGKRCF